MTDTLLQAEDAAQRLRTELRALAQEYQAPLIPTLLREESQLTFSDLIEEFGSVAAGTIEAGMDYYNPGANHDPITILGEDWSTVSTLNQLRASRMILLTDIHQDIKLWESIDRTHLHSTTEYGSYLQRIAHELGRPPTEDYRALRPNEKQLFCGALASGTAHCSQLRECQ